MAREMTNGTLFAYGPVPCLSFSNGDQLIRSRGRAE